MAKATSPPKPPAPPNRAPEPILAKEAEYLDYVKDDIFYKCFLQLGSSRRWRNRPPGKWKRDANLDEPGRDGKRLVGFRMLASVHAIGPFIGEELNGLIASHNKFLEANRERQEPEGLVNRMLLVRDIQEVDTPKPQVISGVVPSHLQEMVLEAATAAAIGAVKATSQNSAK